MKTAFFPGAQRADHVSPALRAGAIFALLAAMMLVCRTAAALETTGVIQKVDPANGSIVVFAGGADRTLQVADDAKFLDAQGKPLADGIKATELKTGAPVLITVVLQAGAPILKSLQLGGRAIAGRGEALGGKPSFGFKPLDEMTAQDRYKGEDGGLYGGGHNDPPAALMAAARAQAALIVPLDAAGKPAADGKIVLISLSMSNATMEFSTFKQVADADPAKSPLVTVVDCAQGGQTMARWADPQANCWAVARQRLSAAGVSLAQVQAAWIKLANAMPAGDLQEHGRQLQRDTVAVLHNAAKVFPNLRIAYLGSRIYGGWSGGPLNPEPYAYEGAFVVRWLIQDQIKGDADLNCDPAHGAVKSPLLLWGPYLWADGVTPRKSDGLVWERADVGSDGTHPSMSGRRKVADMLLRFFKTDPTAKGWFVKP